MTSALDVPRRLLTMQFFLIPSTALQRVKFPERESIVSEGIEDTVPRIPNSTST